jgi:hypothetical protein
MIDRPVLVASAPRSGSSITARIVSSLGYFAGVTKPADEHNPTGYIENRAVESLVIRFLRQHDEYNLGQRFQPFGLDRRCPTFRERVLQEFKVQGKGEAPFVYKDTKTPLVWPVWDRHFPRAQWVLVQRSRAATLASIRRAPFMTHYDDRAKWERYLDRYDRLLLHIASDVPRTHTVNADRLLDGEGDEVAALLSFLGCPDQTDEARSLISPQTVASTHG